MPTVLITGVTGYLGASLAARLVAQEYKVVGISRSVRPVMPRGFEHIDIAFEV